MAQERTLTKEGKYGGKLMSGGTNAGGPGRPPSELRAASREGYGAVMALIQSWINECQKDPAKIAENISNLLQALDKFGKFGLGEPKFLEEDVIRAVAEVLGEDERVPVEAIGDISRRLIEKLKG